MAFCVCSCGNFCYRNKSKVALGHTSSCGCLVKERNDNFGKNKLLAGNTAVSNMIISSYKKSAERRSIDFELSTSEFISLTQGTCAYCGAPPSNLRRSRRKNGKETFTFNGVDRVNNSEGYSLSNCVACCKTCNRIKSNLSVNDMYLHIEAILMHCGDKYDL